MVDELVRSLLYEGYALYPYTPGATKNATPTPFGIVYPPAYAEQSASTFDRARLQCLAEPAGPDARLSASLWFLQPSGERHEAVERHVELGPLDLGQKLSAPFGEGRFTLRSEPLADGRFKVSSCVHNTTSVDDGLDRAAALLSSLISTHIVVRISAGQFISPLESDGCESVNTFPVLATADDDAILGATIVLPDHPQIAPESRGNLFDNTEIEEALLLHVQALSDGERASIADQDPAVREMLARAEAATPEDLLRLHGRVELSDPETKAPPQAPPDPADMPSEDEALVDGHTVRRGDRVVLRPSRDDAYDRMLEGRPARVKRILVDYDGRTHFCVAVEGDPMHELLGETGRDLFFFAHELEVLGA
jgi:hypothetical protein